MRLTTYEQELVSDLKIIGLGCYLQNSAGPGGYSVALWCDTCGGEGWLEVDHYNGYDSNTCWDCEGSEFTDTFIDCEDFEDFTGRLEDLGVNAYNLKEVENR